MARKLTAEWLGPGPARILWPDPDTGPYVVRLHWASVDGVGRLVGIDLRSVETDDRSKPPQPVNTVAPNLGADGTELPARALAPVREPFAQLTIAQWRDFGFKTVEQERSRLLDENRLLRRWDEEEPAISPGAREQLDRTVSGLGRKRPRGPALPDEHYAQVAETVKAARELGDRNILKAIQTAFGGPDKVSRDQANYWRKRAQELGYLPPPRRRTERQTSSSPSSPETF
jgi:hypothetical protein